MMLKGISCSLAVLLAGCLAAKAQDKNIDKNLYIASAIPDSLKQDAHAVIRYSMDEINVSAPGRAVEKHHSVITILDDKADEAAELYVGYDKYNVVKNMQIIAYNADGKVIKKYGKSDAYDRAASDGMSTITDARFMAMRHEIGGYPVTIEVITETSMSSYLDLPDWTFRYKDRAVQNAACKITVNPSVGFRYQNRNTGIQPVKQKDGGDDVYLWKVVNLKAVEAEDDVPEWTVEPKIVFATNSFSYAGIAGDFSTWASFGKWIQGLNNDVCTLSPQRTEEFKQLTAGYKTDKEKARFLYNYMQQNMRYVSIQLGIGGFKPFPATFVDQKKYGDCKALSNYMYAMLKAVGIRSHYVLIRAGDNEEPAAENFPNNPFNHAILCIPFKGDTTWLECTSTTQPFGKLGTFTENRNGLLITEDGGKLVNTPKSTAVDNQFNSEVRITLEPEGGAVAKVRILSTGGYRDLFVNTLPTISQDKQKEYLIRSLNFKQPYSFNFKQSPDSAGVKEVNIDLEYDTFSEVSAGNKKFYRPRVFDLWRATMPVVDKRKSDYYFEHPMQKSCTTVISLPAGFEVSSLPDNVNLKFAYGTYEANYKYDAAKNEVISTVKFNLDKHVIPAARYAEMQKYMDNIATAQSKRLVVQKKV